MHSDEHFLQLRPNNISLSPFSNFDLITSPFLLYQQNSLDVDFQQLGWCLVCGHALRCERLQLWNPGSLSLRKRNYHSDLYRSGSHSEEILCMQRFQGEL